MNILFIPHLPHSRQINRVYEFTQVSNSYFLDWYIENSSFYEKIKSQIFSFFQIISLKNNFMRIPLLFRPERIAVTFNTWVLNYAIKKFNIDVVVNSQAWMFDIEKISVPVVYDLVDDWLTVNRDIGVTPVRLEKIKRDLKNSVGVVAVTEVLENKVKLLNSKTITVENGLYLERFNRSKSLKRELGIEGKKVFGYIGGVDEWTGIEAACKAYMEIKEESNIMLIVGDSESKFFTDLKKKYENDILFVGLIHPKEVGNYFKTLDIGLIPFELNDFTHNAYPIKAIEYGLAGANVISTSLAVLVEKDFPFIHFYNINDFAKGMKEVNNKEFQFNFDNLSWEKQTDKLISFINSVILEKKEDEEKFK